MKIKIDVLTIQGMFMISLAKMYVEPRFGEEERAGVWSPLAFFYPRRVVSYR